MAAVKRYGYVTIFEFDNKMKCFDCGYSWNISDAEKDRYLKLAKTDGNSGMGVVDCPMCKAINNRFIGNAFGPFEDFVFLKEEMMLMDINHLKAYPVIDVNIPVKHITCGKRLTIPASSIKNHREIECQICKEIYLEEQRKKEEAHRQLEEAKLKAKNAENNPNLNQEILDLATSEFDRVMQSSIVFPVNNKILNGKLLDRGLDADGNITYNCIKCGADLIIPKEIKGNKKIRASALKCQSCAAAGKDLLTKLSRRYLNTTHNGLTIIRIYEGDNGVTLCDTECLALGKTSGDGLCYGHITSGLNFGDVINNRCICPECKKNPNTTGKLVERIINQQSTDRMCKTLRDYISLSKMSESEIKNRILYRYYRYNGYEKFVPFSIDFSTLYKPGVHLCDICPLKGTEKCYINHKECTVEERENINVPVAKLVSRADEEADRNIADDEVRARFPNIYRSKEDKNTVGKVYGRQVGDIIYFRDAYIGRNGKLYKFCKCTRHKTEMILSADEIRAFDHELCSEENSKQSMFFDLDPKFLLK